MSKKRLAEYIFLTIVIVAASLAISHIPKWSDRLYGKISACLITVLSLYVLANLRQIKPRDLGLTTFHISSALVICIALILFGVGIGIWKRHLDAGTIWGLIFISSLVGLSEELLLRGYLQTEAARTLGFAKGLTLTSVLFGLFHIPHNIIVSHQSLTGLIIQICVHIIMGLALGTIYHKAGNIWTPAAAHALINSLALINA